MSAAFHCNQQLLPRKDSVRRVKLQLFNHVICVLRMIDHPKVLMVKLLAGSNIKHCEIRTDRDDAFGIF